MNKRVLSLFLCAPLIAAPARAAQASADRPGAARLGSAKPEAKHTTETVNVLIDIPPTAKVVHYSDKDVARLKMKLRYTTLIQLPRNEQILDFLCGDKEFWNVDGNENLAYIKPAKAGAHTNLNLITASGNVYSFMLDEISETPGAQPDLKVFVVLNDEDMMTALKGPRKFVSWEELERARQQTEATKSALRNLKDTTDETIDREVSKERRSVRHVYRFTKGKKPFFVSSMYRDDKSTYIEANPEETPVLYEIKDGKPNVVNYQYRDGIFVVDKILDNGYLAVGKSKMTFSRQE
jgi:type IV secretory pathway VirB9-like protein